MYFKILKATDNWKEILQTMVMVLSVHFGILSPKIAELETKPEAEHWQSESTEEELMGEVGQVLALGDCWLKREGLRQGDCTSAL